VKKATFTGADLAYISENFVTLEVLARSRREAAGDLRARIAQKLAPGPSYVLDDGTEMFSRSYVDPSRSEFDRRYRAAGGDPNELAEDWGHHLSGIYGLCLRKPTPENIVRKEQLARSIGGLLEEPRTDEPEWRERLRAEVDELDELECEFSPHYDRSGARFDEPPSRDRLIKAARERYAQLFESGIPA
jgi:hypothetical protein